MGEDKRTAEELEAELVLRLEEEAMERAYKGQSPPVPDSIRVSHDLIWDAFTGPHWKSSSFAVRSSLQTALRVAICALNAAVLEDQDDGNPSSHPKTLCVLNDAATVSSEMRRTRGLKGERARRRLFLHALEKACLLLSTNAAERAKAVGEVRGVRKRNANLSDCRNPEILACWVIEDCLQDLFDLRGDLLFDLQNDEPAAISWLLSVLRRDATKIDLKAARIATHFGILGFERIETVPDGEGDDAEMAREKNAGREERARRLFKGAREATPDGSPRW